MNKKYYIVIFSFLLTGFLLFIILKCFSFYMLNLKEYPSGENFLNQIIIPGKQFSLKYNHSVAQTPVWEFFEITEDGLLLITETHFYDHGAGLPYTSFGKEKFVEEDGLFKIKNMSRTLELPVYYRIEKNRANVFLYNNTEINLSEELGDTLLTIDIFRTNLWHYFLITIID